MSCNTQAIVSRISPSGVTRQAMDVSVDEDVGLRCANSTYAAALANSLGASRTVSRNILAMQIEIH